MNEKKLAICSYFDFGFQDFGVYGFGVSGFIVSESLSTNTNVSSIKGFEHVKGYARPAIWHT